MRRIGLAFVVVLITASLASAQATPTAPAATLTPTQTATVTVSPSPTPLRPPSIERHRQRDNDPSAKVDTAAPHLVTMMAGSGAAVDGAVAGRFMVMNAFRIRGVVASAVNSSGTVCSAAFKVGATTIATISLVGRGGTSNYVQTGGSNAIDVPPGTEVSVTTAATGTCTGLFGALDTIP